MPGPLGIGIGIWQGALGGGAAPFNPASLFGGEQGVVYDLTDPSKLSQQRTGALATFGNVANNDPIGTLKDLSPNNNYAIAPSDAARPLSRQGVGAPNVYGEGDGVDDFIAATFGIAVTQPFTRIACWQRISGTSAVNILGVPSGGAVVLYCSGVTGYNANAGGDMAVFTALPAENLVSTERINGASSSVAKNNAAYVNGNLGGNTLAGVGFFASASGAFANMRMYRIVVISRILTNSEIAQCRTWCGAAAGLVL